MRTAARTIVSSLALSAAFAVLGPLACIDGDLRAVADTATTTMVGADTTTMVGADSATADATADTTDRECERASDCELVASDCQEVQCIDGTCELAPAREQEGCDDGDACTTGDHCAAGVCAGSPKVCADAGPCHESVCSAETGECVTTVVPDAICDNGVGPAPGACVSGGVVDWDHCDADGLCVDGQAALPPIGPDDPPELAGAWHFVYTRIEGGGAVTVRGTLAFEGGRWRLADLVASGTLPSVWGHTSGTYCASAEGYELAGESIAVHARVRSGRMLFTLSGDDAGLGVAFRADPSRDAVLDGDYRFVATSVGSAGGQLLVTERGVLHFDAGCLASGTLFYVDGEGAERELLVVRDASRECMPSPFNQPATIYGRTLEGTSLVPVEWLVTPDAAGDVLIGTLEADGRPLLGTVILARSDAAAQTSITLADIGWDVGVQGARGTARVGALGHVAWSGPELDGGPLTGSLGTDSALDGWWYVDTTRFATHLQWDRVPLDVVGSLTPDASFAVGWAVPPDGAMALPHLLSEATGWGTMLVMIR